MQPITILQTCIEDFLVIIVDTDPLIIATVTMTLVVGVVQAASEAKSILDIAIGQGQARLCADPVSIRLTLASSAPMTCTLPTNDVQAGVTSLTSEISCLSDQPVTMIFFVVTGDEPVTGVIFCRAGNSSSVMGPISRHIVTNVMRILL